LGFIQLLEISRAFDGFIRWRLGNALHSNKKIAQNEVNHIKIKEQYVAYGHFRNLRFIYFFALSIPASDAKRVEPSVDIAKMVLVRNMRLASEKLAQK
jgi:hypothetical protein